jgi:hypothetical protein
MRRVERVVRRLALPASPSDADPRSVNAVQPEPVSYLAIGSDSDRVRV